MLSDSEYQRVRTLFTRAIYDAHVGGQQIVQRKLGVVAIGGLSMPRFYSFGHGMCAVGALLLGQKAWVSEAYIVAASVAGVSYDFIRFLVAGFDHTSLLDFGIASGPDQTQAYQMGVELLNYSRNPIMPYPITIVPGEEAVFVVPEWPVKEASHSQADVERPHSYQTEVTPVEAGV